MSCASIEYTQRNTSSVKLIRLHMFQLRANKLIGLHTLLRHVLIHSHLLFESQRSAHERQYCI